MTLENGFFELLIQYEVHDAIGNPNKMWQDRSVANLSLSALAAYPTNPYRKDMQNIYLFLIMYTFCGRSLLDLITDPILNVLLNNLAIENSKEVAINCNI